jgi:hypothetical protein
VPRKARDDRAGDTPAAGHAANVDAFRVECLCVLDELQRHERDEHALCTRPLVPEILGGYPDEILAIEGCRPALRQFA